MPGRARTDNRSNNNDDDTNYKIENDIGPDGLSIIERKAYEKCQPLSCDHHKCYSKYMYAGPKKLKKCEKLFQRWQKCFDNAKEIFSAESGRA
mmetsp:Transcript_2307/g.3294  ORF Transcript_2307/g.3294 Transcript_2307/m.3294 type:complete len:93 (+) Transcript_2307:125-403(+)